MTRILTDYDRKMLKKVHEWSYFDGEKFRLRDDAPEDVKKYREEMKKYYD